MDSVLPRVQSLLQEHFSLAAEQTSPAQRLTELGIESLDALEFLFKLEDEFKISLSEERGVFNTVADIASIVEKALTAKHASA